MLYMLCMQHLASLEGGGEGDMEPVIWVAMVQVLGAGTSYNVNKILIS